MTTEDRDSDATQKPPKIYLNADPLQSQQLLTVQEVAYCLNRSRASIYVLMDRKELVGFRHFGKRLFSRDEVQEYIQNMMGNASAA